jgi:hypothetical protein
MSLCPREFNRSAQHLLILRGIAPRRSPSPACARPAYAGSRYCADYFAAIRDKRNALPAIGPPDRCLTDLVLDRQFGHRLAGSVPLGNAPALAGVERSRPAEVGALALGPLDPLLAALADQAALELADARHDRHYQLADPAGRVAPALGEGNEAAAQLIELMHDVEQITGRPRQAVEPGDRDDVAGLERLHELGPIRPAIGRLARGLLPVNTLAARRLQRIDLAVVVLADRADPRISLPHRTPIFENRTFESQKI